MNRPQFLRQAWQAAVDKSPDGWEIAVIAVSKRNSSTEMFLESVGDDEAIFKALGKLFVQMHESDPSRYPITPPDDFL